MAPEDEKPPAGAEDGGEDRGREAPDQEPDEEPVPKLPRARFFTRLTMVDLFRIGLFAILLVAVIVMREPCANSVANFFDMFAAPPPDAGPTLQYERLTEEEIRERFGGPMPGDDGGPPAPEPAPDSKPGSESESGSDEDGTAPSPR